jgi:hypothetical protein
MLGIDPAGTLHVNLIRHGIKFDIPPSNNGNNNPQQAKR